MRAIKLKVVSAWALGAAVLAICFQNCSGDQFAPMNSEGVANLQSVSGEGTFSALPGVGYSSSKVDTVTPRIVLSDTYDGDAKPAFSPKKLIYGTVYGLGAQNVYVCMASYYGCDFWPGYTQPSSTARDYSRPVGELPNWRYQASDKTWRFTLDYSEMGDLIDKVVVHEFVPDSETDFIFFNGPNTKIRLRLEAVVSVRSELSDAGIYFNSWGRDTIATLGADIYGSKVFTKGSGVTSLSGTFTHIAGLGANVSICYEKTGSGRCNSGQNYISLQGIGTYARYSAVRGVWQINNSGVLKVDALGAVGGSYTLYAREALSGKVVSNKFFLNPPTIRCSFASTTAVIGPCSDPETSQTQCTQSNVGQTLQGTGSCKAQYTCKCTSS